MKNDKIVEKIQKLIALSKSDNENEATAAIKKAQELMIKYEIDRSGLDSGRPIVELSSKHFRDDWILDIAITISLNFRCRILVICHRRTGGVFHIRFFGFEEDVAVCHKIFEFAVKTIRKKMVKLREKLSCKGENFGRNQKKAYVEGFCRSLQDDFDEQRSESEAFSIMVVPPKEVDDFLSTIPISGELESRGYQKKGNKDIYMTGYMDGMEFYGDSKKGGLYL